MFGIFFYYNDWESVESLNALEAKLDNETINPLLASSLEVSNRTNNKVGLVLVTLVNIVKKLVRSNIGLMERVEEL